MKSTMNKEEAQVLRANSKQWMSICRGFKIDPNGTQTIRLRNQIYTGDWVYGYYVPSNNGFSLIYGGTDTNDIFAGRDRIEVLKDSICRCTGLIVESGDSVGNVLFEYDVVDASTVVECTVKKRFFVFDDAYIYWHAPTLSWGIMSSDEGKGYPFNHEWSFKIKGTVFDISNQEMQKGKQLWY